MDDYILQILKANSVAKDQVKETIDSHAEDVKALERNKQLIDQELDAFLTKETARIQQLSQSFHDQMKPKYDQKYIERVNDLTDRFNGATSEWYSVLFEGITTFNGK